MAGIQVEGIFPPIPTPFDPVGEVDVKALQRNLEHWSRFGLAGYVVLGSNGEAVHLDDRETALVLETAREAIPPSRLMFAGVGRPSTRETIAWCQRAASLGADAALVLAPHYYRNAMTSGALVSHFRAVADASPLPIILYNMPACTGLDLGVETVLSLAEHENVVGLKDSSGNVTALGEIRHHAAAGFAVIAGSAGFLVPALAIGACGGILALANIAPSQCVEMYDASRQGDLDRARAIQLTMIRPNTTITRGWGVPALKAAMDMLGLHGGEPRSPLAPLSEARREALRSILIEARILDPAKEEKTR